MLTCENTADLAQARAALAGAGQSGLVAAVLTMGALHEGHAELIRQAREHVGGQGRVFVTIFVNPLQFGPNEDYSRYPRTLDADLAVAEAAGADAIYLPSVSQMYPAGEPVIRIDPGPLGSELEGAIRPGHFIGVLTVVAKLLNQVHADVTFFGEKDYQQLVLVRRMCSDLDLGVEVVGVPTVREPDGLALSSRNRYLAADERAAAVALSTALSAGAAAATTGADAVVGAARAVLADAASRPGFSVDYLVLRDPDLGPSPQIGPARLVVAARVGTTRLLDNMAVVLSPVRDSDSEA